MTESVRLGLARGVGLAIARRPRKGTNQGAGAGMLGNVVILSSHVEGDYCNWRHLLPPTALKGPPWTQPQLALRTLVHGSLPRPEASAGGRGGLGWRVHLTVLVHDLRTLVHGPLPRPEASAGGRGGSGHYSRASLCLGNKASKVVSSLNATPSSASGRSLGSREGPMHQGA